MKYELNLELAEQLTAWYQKNQRSLPWRNTGNPYHVWISEIMLQQTRIEAVKPKYLSFIETLPSIQSLAEVDIDTLMRLWEGLGYYSRARNLKKCAEVLMEKHDGTLPSDYDALRKLPGIGPYTAGAIRSIAYGKPAAAVDGNVMRVLARLFAIDDDIRDPKVKNRFEEIIADTFQKRNDSLFVSSFNQGIMELGEIVCKPNGLPNCANCPWNHACVTHAEERYDDIPYRSALKPRKMIERTLLVLRDGDSFLLRKRPSTGLLAGLYEFYGIEKHCSRSDVIHEVENLGLTPLHIKKLPDAKHIFTHLEWHMCAYEVTVAEIETILQKNMRLANKQDLAKMAIPSAFKTYVDWYQLRDENG